MAKVPLAGTVKTRLQPILSPEKCAELADAFLQDAIKKAESICKNVILAYSPAGQSDYFNGVISSKITLVEQKGEDLGEKMSNTFEFAFFDDPDSAVVLIGTDSPTFPAVYLARAFSTLETDAEIVLGKSKDGGFYLIGLRKPVPELFAEIAWSSPRVFTQMTENLKKLNIENLKLMPEHYDVDTPEDLLMMKNEILGDESLQKSVEKTFQWLMKNSEII